MRLSVVNLCVHCIIAHCRIVSGLAKLVGQNPYHGAWSTIFAATSPSLEGKGWAYIGPNILGLVRRGILLCFALLLMSRSRWQYVIAE